MFYITSNDGVKLAVYEYNPQGQDTIFLVHGWPLSHKIYEYQLELLINQNFRIITMDLRGFGESDTPAFHYCYDQMAQDIYQVVCKLNLTNFILVGFSMGGAIVLRYMNKCKGYGVKKLILLAAAAPCWTMRPDYPYGLTKEYVNQLIETACTNRPQLAYHFSHCQLFASPHGEPIKNWFNDIALSASLIGTVQSAIALRDEDGRKDLSCVHVPTWIIHGAKDVVVSNDLAYIQNKCISDSVLLTLNNSGHGIMYDELSVFNEAFLKAVLC